MIIYTPPSSSINPNGFIKNQTTLQSAANFDIDGSGVFGQPFVTPTAAVLNATALAFINQAAGMVGGQSALFGLDYQDLAVQRLARLTVATTFAAGINQFSGRPYNFQSELRSDIAPTLPTGVVRLEDLISGPIPGTPSIVAGSALGGGTVQIFGNNFMGQVQFTTGAVPLPSGVLATISFGGGASYLTAATPVIGPAQAGSDVNGIALVGVNGGTTSWDIIVNAVALAAATSYRFNYICGGVD